MNVIKRNKYVLSTFVISFIIMTVAFANEKLFPFGTNQIMIIDSWHQYYPFLQELHHKLTHGGSLFYSWNTGAGSNFFLIMAYYAMSPLNLLSIFFPKEYLREFMLLATILKISFAGTFFAIYIRGLFKRNDVSLVIFGLMYAFSGYAMGYYWDIMWLDCMALLPLIILGLHKVLDEEGFLLYTLSLAIAVFSSFYIGYFICEFIMIYSLVLYFTKFSWQGIRHALQKASDVAFYTVIGLGLAAVTLIPTFNGMKLAYGLSSGDPKTMDTYYSLMDICNNLLANVPPTIKNGLPNIYCGIFAVILLIFYFITATVSIRSKVFNFLLILFFLFSFNINYMDFVWHGFHFPNEVPYRFSFMFSFLILTFAYEAYLNLDTIMEKTVWTVGAGFIGYLMVCEKLYTQTFDYKVFYVSMLLVVIYCGFILLLKYQKVSRGVFTGFLCYVIVGEVLLSALNATHTAGTSGRNEYPAQDEAVQKAISKLYESDNGFYRLEMFRWYSVNDPALYGYRGISQFASTSNSKVNSFADSIGLQGDAGSNTILFAPSTPIINGLFSVKYMLSKGGAINVPNAAYEVVDQEKDLTVLRNRYALPLGFMVNAGVSNWKTDAISPFKIQEEFLSLATGNNGEVFKNVPAASEAFVNMELTKREQGIRFHYRNIDKDKKANAILTFRALETGQMYVYMLDQTKTVKVTVKGKSNDYDPRRGVIIDMGIMQAGEEFVVDFDVIPAETGYFDIEAVVFSPDKFDLSYHLLADEPFEVKEFSDTRVSGTIDVRRNGTLYTSIPYEKGWEAVVDGAKAQIVPLNGAMITLPLSKGAHLIEFSYVPTGFKQGAIISCISVILLADCIRQFRRRKRSTDLEEGPLDVPNEPDESKVQNVSTEQSAFVEVEKPDEPGKSEEESIPEERV